MLSLKLVAIAYSGHFEQFLPCFQIYIPTIRIIGTVFASEYFTCDNFLNAALEY